MAIDALEHAAVHRFLKLVWIYVEADRLPIHFVTQTGVAMACEAVVIRRLGCGLLSGNRYHRKEPNCREC